jgi:hypothetical protein
MLRRLVVSLVLLSAALPAFAQDSTPSAFRLGDYGDSKQRNQAPQPKAGAYNDPSPIHLQGLRWPWLEPGAIVCNSQAALDHYHADLAARLEGAPAPTLAPGCRRLARRTSIDVADRLGPATVEVRLNNDSKQTGWTDAYLPTQRPTN